MRHRDQLPRSLCTQVTQAESNRQCGWALLLGTSQRSVRRLDVHPHSNKVASAEPFQCYEDTEALQLMKSGFVVTSRQLSAQLEVQTRRVNSAPQILSSRAQSSYCKCATTTATVAVEEEDVHTQEGSWLPPPLLRSRTNHMQPMRERKQLLKYE